MNNHFDNLVGSIRLIRIIDDCEARVVCCSRYNRADVLFNLGQRYQNAAGIVGSALLATGSRCDAHFEMPLQGTRMHSSWSDY